MHRILGKVKCFRTDNCFQARLSSSIECPQPPDHSPSISLRSVVFKWIEQPSWIVTVLVAAWGYRTNKKLQSLQAEHQANLARISEERREEERIAKLGIQQTQILILLSQLRTPIRVSIQKVLDESYYHSKRSTALSLGAAELADDYEIRKSKIAPFSDVLEVMDAVEVIETTRQRELISDADAYSLFGWMASAVMNTQHGLKEISSQPKGWGRFLSFSLMVAEMSTKDPGVRGSTASRWALRREFLQKIQSFDDNIREEIVRRCQFRLDLVYPEAFARCVTNPDQQQNYINY